MLGTGTLIRSVAPQAVRVRESRRDDGRGHLPRVAARPELEERREQRADIDLGGSRLAALEQSELIAIIGIFF